MGTTVSNSTAHKIRHDLQAPTVNVRGFVGEIGRAIHELTALLDQNYEQLPEGFAQQVNALMVDDLRPCLDFLDRASLQLDGRIEEVAQILLEGDESADRTLPDDANE